MIWLALILAAAPCPGVEGVAEGQQEAACAFLQNEKPQSEPALTKLGDIYERPEFSHARERNTGAFAVWLNRLKSWFLELFGSSAAAKFSDVTRLVVLFAGALIAVLFVVRFLKRGGPKKVRVGTEEQGSQSLHLDDPAVHLQRAMGLLKTQPREATRQGLLALLSMLEKHRMARPDRVKTNRELVLELPARGTPAEIVENVTSSLHWYDQAYYSLEPIEVPAAQKFLEQIQALNSRIEARPQ